MSTTSGDGVIVFLDGTDTSWMVDDILVYNKTRKMKDLPEYRYIGAWVIGKVQYKTVLGGVSTIRRITTNRDYAYQYFRKKTIKETGIEINSK